MFRINHKLLSAQAVRFAIFGCVLTIALTAPALTQAQRSKGATTPTNPDDNQPAFHELRGLHIGMLADEARKKLGTPKEKSAEQDFYQFDDSEYVQVNYDKTGAVVTIAVDYMAGAKSVPTPKEVFGSESEAKADGSFFKRVDYTKAGYWISYARTAGSDSTTTITIQKLH